MRKRLASLVSAGRRLRACVLLLALCLAVVRVRAADHSRVFTPDEWRRLDAGSLILRPATRDKGSLRLMGGSSWQVIDAEPDAVWKALLDTPRYPHMMPQLLEARLIRTVDNVRTVFMRQGAEGVVEASYFLKVNVYEQRHDITFAVDGNRPHEVLRAAWGSYSVRPYREGKTLLTYSVMADVEGGPLLAIMRDTVHEWMLRTPSMVKRFIEGSGRHFYH